MSGVRGVGMPAYAHISYRRCPVCGRPTKNFEMHTRNREDHKIFRQLQEQWFRQLMLETADKMRERPDWKFDSGIVTALNQKAWIKAIEQLGGSTEKVDVPEKPLPKHAITLETICPKTNQKVDEKECSKCLDRATAGSQAAIKYFVCMELKRKRKR